MLIVIACFSIWTYRNYQVFGVFIPLSTHGGDAFYAGNNPDADVSAWFNSLTDEEVRHKTKRMNEVEMDRFFKKEAVKFWKENPGRGVELYLLKFLNYFDFQNRFYINSEFNQLKSIIMFVTYYPILICLVVRLYFIPKIRLSRLEVLLVLTYLTSALFHAVFVTRIRYRLPYDVLLITHIGIMYSLLINRIKSREIT